MLINLFVNFIKVYFVSLISLVFVDEYDLTSTELFNFVGFQPP